MFTFIAFDVETTGVNVERSEIIEIGAVRFVNGKPVDTFQSLISIKGSIPSEATRVHGITEDMLAGQPVIADVLEQFTVFCADATLVAHNAPFDIKFINAAAEQHGITLPPKLVLDSYVLAKRSLPELFNHRLETLVKHFKIESGTFHRAAEDACSCGQLLVELLKIMSKKEAPLTPEKLITLNGGKLHFASIASRARQMNLL